MEDPRDWIRAIEQTWVVRFPKQHLATFGMTNISYYVVTEPIYRDLAPEKHEGVVRTGRVIAQKPAIVTPTYAMSLQGFSSEAYDYLQHLAQAYGPNSPGILYQYRNEADKMDIVSGSPSEIAGNIDADLERRQENLAVVMVGVDEYWDVSLLKFIYEFTSKSAVQNMEEMQTRGLLEPQPNYGGIPKAAIQRIEQLFREATSRASSRDMLKEELDRWGVFEYYEDRFLNLYRGNRS